MARTRSCPLTVADSATTSGAFIASGEVTFGLVVPSGFDGTTITFTVSADDPAHVAEADATYQALYNASNVQVSMTLAASRSYDLPAELSAWPRWKIVTGTAQTNATVFTVVGKAP